MDEISESQPITDVSRSTLTYLWKHPLWVIIPLLATVAVVIVAVLFGGAGDLAAFEYVILCAIVFFIPSMMFVRGRVQDEFMRQFAEANGYTFSLAGTTDRLDGALFRLGNGFRRAHDMVSGQYLNRPIALFDYQYETGVGRSRQMHNYTVFELQFDVAMPDMLLEKKEPLFTGSVFGQLPEQIKLEGDFNRYFSLSIKKGYEVEALEVFTPDVMADLIEKCKGLSLEIVNSHLFIYENKNIATKADLYAFYDIARYFVEKLGPVLARMKPALAAMN
jgi:hypothetical protein